MFLPAALIIHAMVGFEIFTSYSMKYINTYPTCKFLSFYASLHVCSYHDGWFVTEFTLSNNPKSNVKNPTSILSKEPERC